MQDVEGRPEPKGSMNQGDETGIRLLWNLWFGVVETLARDSRGDRETGGNAGHALGGDARRLGSWA